MEEGKLFGRVTLVLLIVALTAAFYMATLGPTEATLPAPSPTPYSSDLFSPVIVPARPSYGIPPSMPPMPEAMVRPVVMRPTTRPMTVAPTAIKVRPVRLRASAGVRGIATYYCNATHAGLKPSRCMTVHPDTGSYDAYAAAGPALRVALGGNAGSACPCPWRNRVVTVTSASGDTVRVKLADWCACGGGHVIDLYGDPFWALEAKGKVNPVTVSW